MNSDRRLAIVEGAAWVMVRVGGGQAEAKLVLGARVEGCSAAAYTTRVPLTHPLALLHYTSAQGVSLIWSSLFSGLFKESYGKAEAEYG